MARAHVLPFELNDFDAPPSRAPERRPESTHNETAHPESAPVAPPPSAIGGDALDAARAEGVAAGRRAALDEQKAEMSALAATIGEQIAGLDAALAEERRRLRRIAAAFLTRFAEGLSAARETEIAASLVDRLLAASDDRAPARLFLHPDSVKEFSGALRQALEARGAEDFIEIAADEALARGECRLVWRGGAGARLLNPALASLDEALRGEIAPPRSGAGWRPLKLSMETAHEHA